MRIYENKKYLAIVLSIVLALTGIVSDTANAVKAKVIPTCVDPILKYSNMKKLNKSQLLELLRLSGFKGKALKTAWAVAMKETHGNPVAHNYNPHTGDNSYGVFQINLYGALKGRISEFGLKSAEDLTDPVTNAHIAYLMSNGGKNWAAWHSNPGQRDYHLVKQYRELV